MIAADVATVLLIIGIGALSVTTVVTGLSLPRIAFRRRRRQLERRPTPPRAIPQRRAVTGPRVQLPPLPLPAAPRQTGDVPDRQQLASDAQAAEQLIERLLDADPEALADVMTTWIRSDIERTRDDQQ